MSILDRHIDRQLAKMHRAASPHKHVEIAEYMIDRARDHLSSAREKHGAQIELNTSVITDLRTDTTERLAEVSEANRVLDHLDAAVGTGV